MLCGLFGENPGGAKKSGVCNGADTDLEKPLTGTRYLFLDEPLTSPNINYQQEFLQIAREFTNNETVLVAVIHDINLATQYADKLFFLKRRRTGSPRQAKRNFK